jgi:hypothetical protein
MLGPSLENVRRQRVQLPVCVVETGEGEGACAAHGYAPDLLLRGPAHPAHSRNEALKRLALRDAHCIFMDDDDYYGPGYVEEHLALRERGRVVGKVVFWVRWPDEKYLTLYGSSRANKWRPWLRGGTMAGFAREMGEFPDLRLGEDAGLCQNFLKQGGAVWCSSVSHCVYMRYDDEHGHIYRPAKGVFLAHNGPIKRHGSLCDVNRGDVVLPPSKELQNVDE